MDLIISVKSLKKYYQVTEKEPGITGSLKALFSRKYKEVPAVNDISFDINEGELVGFIGPNGAGKTTTLKVLSGLLYPTLGEVKVAGFTPWERKPEFLKKIALIMGQKNQLWWDLPAIDTFVLNKEIYEISDTAFKKTLNELTELLDVKELLNTPSRKLSLGQRMKMELLASLLHNPKILFLDEPTIGLDVVMQKSLRDFIKDYNKRFSATIILTSHYMADVRELAERIIIINKGKIIFDGKLRDVVSRFAKYKILKIILGKEVDRKRFEGYGEVENYNFPEVTLLVQQNEVAEVTANVLKSLPIADLNIEEVPLEDIIRKIFKAGKVK